jgi:hypothetical protein
MCGCFKADLQRLLSEINEGDSSHLDTDRPKPLHYAKDLETFVEEYKTDGLFDYSPGRSHTAFPNFTRETNFKSPYKLGKVLKCHSDKMDRWANIRERSQHNRPTNI